MQAIVPHFIEREQGHVIDVSSFLGRVPLVNDRSACNAAKAALNALTANLRVDLARTRPGIHVSLVIPGVVSTELARNALGGVRQLPPGVMPGRSQSPEEAAGVSVALIGNPVPEVYTNPAQAGVVARYYTEVAAFERASGPRGLNLDCGSPP